MASHIGGRIETVKIQPSLFGPDYIRLLLLAVIAVAVHVWMLSHTALTARDSLTFARYALKLEKPAETTNPPDKSLSIVDVIKQEEHPPGYPAAVMVVSRVLRFTTNLPLPEAMMRYAIRPRPMIMWRACMPVMAK